MLSFQQLSLSYAPAAALAAPRTVPRSVTKMETVRALTPSTHALTAHALPKSLDPYLLPPPSLARGRRRTSSRWRSSSTPRSASTTPSDSPRAAWARRARSLARRRSSDSSAR
eukprot:scaffold22156_cov23-Phaeocystis_antarctica.AAC.1